MAAVWPGMLLGAGLILVAAGAGWVIARVESAGPVRLVSWWIRRIILPLLRSERWLVRMAIIFLNNLAVLALVVLVGRWSSAAVAAIAFLGLNLGIGLRVLSGEAGGALGLDHGGDTAARTAAIWKLRIGMALNMLEPPAIMLALGLSLHRSILNLSAALLWETFVVWIVPATLVAAGGEALWLGVLQRSRRANDRSDSIQTTSRFDE